MSDYQGQAKDGRGFPSSPGGGGDESIGYSPLPNPTSSPSLPPSPVLSPLPTHKSFTSLPLNEALQSLENHLFYLTLLANGLLERLEALEAKR